MLENSVGSPDQDRVEYKGRVQYPERLHVVARVIDITTQLLADLIEFAEATASEVADWSTPTDSALTNSTRQILEAIRDRNNH